MEREGGKDVVDSTTYPFNSMSLKVLNGFGSIR